MKTFIFFLLLLTSPIIHGQSTLLKQINIVQGISFRTIPLESSNYKTKHTYDIGIGVEIVKLFNNNGLIIGTNFLRYASTTFFDPDNIRIIKTIHNSIDIGLGYKRYFNKLFCSVTANPYYRFARHENLWGINSYIKPQFNLASTLRIGYENFINSSSLKYNVSIEYKIIQLLNIDGVDNPNYPFYIGINIGLIKI